MVLILALLRILVKVLQARQPLAVFVVHVRSTCANFHASKVIVERTQIDGGSMLKLETVRSSFILDVRAMQTTSRLTKNARIIVVTPEVNHSASKVQRSRIQMETSLFVVDRQQHRHPVQQTTIVITMEPHMDAVPHKLTPALYHTSLVRLVVLPLLVGIMTRPPEHVRRIRSMDAMATRIILQHNKTARTIVALSLARMEERCGRNKMVQLVRVPQIGNVHRLTIVRR